VIRRAGHDTTGLAYSPTDSLELNAMGRPASCIARWTAATS
jgi:hypothetical protein